KKENSLTDENAKKKERNKAEKAFDKAVLQYKKLRKAKDEVLDLEEKYENIQQFDELTQAYVELFDMAENKSSKLLKKVGQRKTAAAWIEEVQNKIKKKEDITIDDIAIIIAARQLGDAVAGKAANIKSHYINEGELNDRVNLLKNDIYFREFVAVKQGNENPDPENDIDLIDLEKGKFVIDPSLLTDGHGGRLEKELASFIAENKTYDIYKEIEADDPEELKTKVSKYVKKLPESSSYTVLDKDLDGSELAEGHAVIKVTHTKVFSEVLYSRYHDYKLKESKKISYEEAVKDLLHDYKGKNGKVQIKSSDKDAAMRAAGILAAYSLKGDKNSFSVDKFEKTSKKIMEAPDFKYMRRHKPETLNLLTTGKVDQYLSETRKIMGMTIAQMGEAADKATNLKVQELMEANINIQKERVKIASGIVGSIKIGNHYGTESERKNSALYHSHVSDARKEFKFLNGLSGDETEAIYVVTQKIGFFENNFKEKNNVRKDDLLKLDRKKLSDVLSLLEDFITARMQLDDKFDATKYMEVTDRIRENANSLLNPPEFKDKEGKSAGEQLNEYKIALGEDILKATEEFTNLAMQEKKKDVNNSLFGIETVIDGYSIYDNINDTTRVKKYVKAEKKDIEEIDKAFTLHIKALEEAKKNNVKDASKYLEAAKEVQRLKKEYSEPPVFRDKKKTAKKQLEEYQQKKGLQYIKAAKKYMDKYDADMKKKTEEYIQKAVKKLPSHIKPTTMKYEINTARKIVNGKAIDNKLGDYAAKRGPKFNKMVEAGDEYVLDDGSPVKTMKLIDAILDYQKGKEKVTSGEQAERFIDSMRLLAEVTMGTPHEKIFTDQLNRVNKLRGAKPGSKNYIDKKEIFVEFKDTAVLRKDDSVIKPEDLKPEGSKKTKPMNKGKV
ncbi:MAG: hypothetical protein K6F00_01205, partial [Lachnospiraceae bacterium]|nr:hypothetical protein [Lachnospiraceae bacterium]